MTDGPESVARRRLAALGFTAACILTLWALVLNHVTVARNDYTWIVIQSVGCAALAVALVALSWNGMPVVGRVIGALLLAANLWTLVDAGGRGLPAVLGW